MNKIPKKIHYVWVGNNPKSKIIKKCMKTWNKHLICYEVIEWNENNFDINSHPFVKKAYEAKSWAFVSDYIRAWAIYNYGGIYLDTDILLLDNFDNFLEDNAFVGYENDSSPFTAVFGAEKGHKFLKDILDYYDNCNLDFNFKDNNTLSVSKLLIEKYNCKTGNIEQKLDSGIKVYKDTVLCNPSKNSVSIHIFTGTWLKGNKGFIKNIVTFLKLHLKNKFLAEIYRIIIRK